MAIPCLPLLINAIVSISPFVFSYTYNLSLYLTLALIIPVLIILYISTKNVKRDFIISLFCFFSALLTTNINSSHITIHNSKASSYIQIQGIVENVHYHDEILKWDANKGARVSLKLNKIYKNSKWLDCSGRIQIFDEDNILK